jgi:hypothetical protein
MQPGIKTDAKWVRKELRRAVLKQLPFITAVTLTRSAEDARDKVRQKMDATFHIRSQRVRKGIQIKRAEKRAWPKVVAYVGTKDQFIADHALGKTRKAIDGGTHIAVPSRDTEKRGRTSTGRIKKSFRPGVLIGKGKARKTGPRGFIVRTTKARRGKIHPPVFLLRRAIKIRATWPLEKQVLAEARRVLPGHFKREARLAIRPRKRKS